MSKTTRTEPYTDAEWRATEQHEAAAEDMRDRMEAAVQTLCNAARDAGVADVLETIFENVDIAHMCGVWCGETPCPACTLAAVLESLDVDVAFAAAPTVEPDIDLDRTTVELRRLNEQAGYSRG